MLTVKNLAACNFFTLEFSTMTSSPYANAAHFIIMLKVLYLEDVFIDFLDEILYIRTRSIGNSDPLFQDFHSQG